MNIESKNINEYIKIISASAGISLAEVARRIDEKPQQLAQRMKKGKLQSDLEYLQKVANACGYDFIYDFRKKENSDIIKE